MQKSKANIVLLADVKNWAFDNIAQYLKPLLSDEYNVNILYTEDYKNPKELLFALTELKDVKFVHFFYRGYLKSTIEHIANHNIPEDLIGKFLKMGITTSVPDHLYIGSQKDINDYTLTFLFADNYYTTSSKLHQIYSNINLYPAPWKEVIFDNILTEPKPPEFTSNDKLIVAWVGNSAWGEWHFEKGYDPKGYNTVIVPVMEKLAQDNEVEFIIADGHVKKRSKQEIFDILAKTDILLIAATTDGTPLPLIEAMASGCAIITTHNGIAPEVLPEIQQQFIVKKDAGQFIERIRFLKKNPETLLKLKQANYEVYKTIFANNNVFKQAWSALIASTITTAYTQGRVERKKQILKLLQRGSASSGKFLSFKTILANKLVRKTVKIIASVGFIKKFLIVLYSFLNRSVLQASINDLKTAINTVDLARDAGSGTKSNFHAIYHSKYPGVANSTITLFKKSIPINGLGLAEYLGISGNNITKIANDLIASPIEHLVLSGGNKVMFDLIDKLSELKKDKKLKLYFLWHGSPAQWNDQHHIASFNRAYKQYNDGKIASVIVLKKGLEKVLNSYNIKSHLLQNFIQVNSLPEPKTYPNKIFKVGLWSAYATWVKNLYPQLMAVNIIKDKIQLYTNFAVTQENDWLVSQFNRFLFPQEMSHGQLLNLISNSDITLYVTNSECSPMIALESLGNGVPCIVGPTSDLYAADDYLNTMLTVNRVDCAYEIAKALSRVMENYEEIVGRIPVFVKAYNANARKLFEELESATEGA